jgi:hypothetical protein
MAAEDRGPQVAAVAILFLTLSWVFVALRVWGKAYDRINLLFFLWEQRAWGLAQEPS